MDDERINELDGKKILVPKDSSLHRGPEWTTRPSFCLSQGRAGGLFWSLLNMVILGAPGLEAKSGMDSIVYAPVANTSEEIVSTTEATR